MEMMLIKVAAYVERVIRTVGGLWYENNVRESSCAMLEYLSWQLGELGRQVILIIHEGCCSVSPDIAISVTEDDDLPVPGTASACLGSKIPNGMVDVDRVCC